MSISGCEPSRLVLSSGEPAGIGPDLCVMLAQKARAADLAVLADPGLLEKRAARLGLPLVLDLYEPDSEPVPQAAGRLKVMPLSLPAAVEPGRLNPANAAYVLDMLERAARQCLDGRFDAVVTAPVSKSVINDAGIPFSGHTEFFAEVCGAQTPVMLLAAPGLRVALATTHLPLRAVPDAITAERLDRVLRILDQDLRRRFAIPAPRILVCGLNPHAGEGGHLGREEGEVIGPTLERLRGEGLNLHGPLPADTLFTPKYLATADAVLAMYHDQGLPVLKYSGFGNAVNVTLGLPLIRTSVDHGIALDLAGTGKADPGSLEAAVACAVDMVRLSRSVKS